MDIPQRPHAHRSVALFGGVKNRGVLIEGHGGLLHRLHSVVCAARVCFRVVRDVWTS